MFNKNRDKNEMDKMKEMLDPLFMKYMVNMVFTGYVHGYMCIKKVVEGWLEDKGTSYLIVEKLGLYYSFDYFEEEDDLVAARSKDIV